MRSASSLSNHHVSATEILDRVNLIDIMIALGFERPRRGNRTRCIIHGGAGFSFSFNETKGVWNCFRCNEGGGKIDLVSRVTGTDRKGALQWIADLAGIPLCQSTHTPEERRAFASTMATAKGEATELLEWRDRVLAELRARRDIYQHLHTRAVTLAARRPGHPLAGEVEAVAWPIVCELDKRIQWYRETPFPTLLQVLRTSRVLGVAA